MFDGFLVGIYIFGYGFVRFFIEFFREPDYQLGFVLGFMSMGQVLCLLMMAAGITIIDVWRSTQTVSSFHCEFTTVNVAISITATNECYHFSPSKTGRRPANLSLKDL